MRPGFQVTMTMHELDRLKCIQAVVDGELRPSVAAKRLQKSPRQIQRLAPIATGVKDRWACSPGVVTDPVTTVSMPHSRTRCCRSCASGTPNEARPCGVDRVVHAASGGE